MIPVSKFVKVFFFSTNNKVSYVKKKKRMITDFAIKFKSHVDKTCP